MSNGYGMISSGVNKTLEFLAGVKRGQAKRQKQEQQEKMRQMITQLGQQGSMSTNIKISPEGEMSFSLTPGKAPKPTEYGSPEQTKLRQAYGLQPMTEEQRPQFTPSGIPFAGGGYVGIEPGRVPQGSESFEGAVPLPEYAPAMFEKHFARPTRERYEQAGYRPEIAGFKRKKEEEVMPARQIKTEADMGRVKAQLFLQYVESLSPGFNINAYQKKYGGKEAAEMIAKKLKFNKEDFENWIEQQYPDLAKKLFKEKFYLEALK